MKKALTVRQITFTAGETPAAPIELVLTGLESRVEVCVGRGAKAVIYDASTSGAHNVSVVLEAESELVYVSLSAGGSARTFRSTVAEGASMHWHCTTIGHTAHEHSLLSVCTGRNAKSDIDWIFSLRGDEKQVVSARNVFAAPAGGGEMTLKGVAEGKAHAGCNGMIEITEQGGGTNTYLTEDVLMLDATAKIDAIPGLEIRTNDVKASHSATVSRVTPEDLFYFRSRGITPDTARDMYVDGFLGDLTERIPDEGLRTTVRQALVRHTS